MCRFFKGDVRRISQLLKVYAIANTIGEFKRLERAQYGDSKEQTEFLLRSEPDFSFWGLHATVNIPFAPENENMVFVLASNGTDAKYTGSWRYMTQENK